MGVIGAILGDIAGSRWEFAPNPAFGVRKTMSYDLFTDSSEPTDDTIMTIACMDACHHDNKYEKYYRKYGKLYPDAGYGRNFRQWLNNKKMGPYNSYGNGSAMRCSYIGQYYPANKVEHFATLSAFCTHNHYEGLKGAIAAATCVCMAENGADKDAILKSGIEYYPSADYMFSCAMPTSTYAKTISYGVSCQGSVPVAIRCFYETASLEECLYLVNSMSIDTDTVGAIAGAICDSFYGTSEEHKGLVKRYLDVPEYRFLYKKLTKYKVL